MLNKSKDNSTELQTSRYSYDEKTKKQIVISVMTSLVVGNFMNDNIVTFLPIFVQQNKWHG